MIENNLVSNPLALPTDLIVISHDKSCTFVVIIHDLSWLIMNDHDQFLTGHDQSWLIVINHENFDFFNIDGVPL